MGVTHIRAISREDLAAIRELAIQARGEGFRFVDSLIAKLEEPSVRGDSQPSFFLGVIEGDRLVAVAGVTPDPYIDDPGVGRIRHVYVCAERRGTGLGRSLIRELETRARDVYRVLRLRAGTESAGRFYERLGYRAINSNSATHELG